jgi:hypothetical protein
LASDYLVYNYLIIFRAISVDKERLILASLRDIELRLDRMQADLSRLPQQKTPDRFVPLQEATRYLHCGRDWLLAQIKGGVLRPGIDFLDRTSAESLRKRYLVNPVSALRWLNGADPVPVRTKIKKVVA